MAQDLKIYIHQKGDEFWISGFMIFPVRTSFITLSTSKHNNMSLALASFREIRTVLHSKEEMPCTDNAKDSEKERELFVQCSKQQLWRNLPPNINCTVADMYKIIPKNATMQECSNTDIAHDAYLSYSQYLNEFVTQPWKYGCQVPCRQTHYRIMLEYYHKNNAILFKDMIKFGEGHFTFLPIYSTFMIEEEIEKLEYDFGSLLVSAGGNLGLFLGFSCLSVLFFVIEWFQKYF
jgi:hypothetical protein